MDKIIAWHQPSDIEEELITSAFVICFYQKQLLLGFNNWRNQLEIPAGKREKNENIYETAKREFFEETHQELIDLKWIEVVELEDNQGERRFRGIFLGKIESMVKFNREKFDEMSYLKLVSMENLPIKKMDALDYFILNELKSKNYL